MFQCKQRNDHNNHHLISKKKPNLFFCDLFCKNDYIDKLIISSKRYNSYDYNLRLKCSQTDQCLLFINENKLKLIDNQMPYNYCDFGSLIDWIPIIRDFEHDFILINLNPESQYHGKLALCSVDDHRRCGFYTIWEETSIQNIIDEIQLILIESNSKQIKSSGWDDFYELPIKTIMERIKMRMHYG